MLTVAPFTASAGEWDGFARVQRGYTHFHSYGWRAVTERVFGHECIYIAARDGDGALHGVLPLVRVRSLVFGHYLMSMPFVNYGGPLGADDAIVALVQHASTIARATGVNLLELRSRVALPIAADATHRKITVVLDLPSAPQALLKSFEAKLRSQVRRPAKEGVTIRFGADQVAPFFAVFAQHMRDLGTPTQPEHFFAALAEQFGDDVWFGCAYLGELPIACGCGFRWGTEFEMTWASSLRAHSRLSANMGLYFAFMERAIQHGLTRFNFGRCSPGSGTHRFKQQWGGRDEALWWYQPVAEGAAATPSPDSGAFSWGPRVWRRLPTRLTSALGPRIVRYIP